MVTYDQQSIDMSLYAACVLLSNKGTTEKKAVNAYNANNADYVREMEYRLACLGTEFVD